MDTARKIEKHSLLWYLFICSSIILSTHVSIYGKEEEEVARHGIYIYWCVCVQWVREWVSECSSVVSSVVYF